MAPTQAGDWKLPCPPVPFLTAIDTYTPIIPVLDKLISQPLGAGSAAQRARIHGTGEQHRCLLQLCPLQTSLHFIFCSWTERRGCREQG